MSVPTASEGVTAESPARAFFRGARAAIVVLTRVPAGGFPYTDLEWRWSAAHLPLVSAAVGAVAALAGMAAIGAGALVSGVVTLVASVALTGALHEDGMADTADALFGGHTKERVLAILKDSRIGAFGATALGLTLFLRVALVARFEPHPLGPFVIAAAASRLAPVVLLAVLPYVTDPAVAKSPAFATVGRAQVAVGAVWVLLVVAVVCALGGAGVVEVACALAAFAATAVGCGLWFRARVGGTTGDFLGFAQQATECAILLAIAVARGGPP